MDAANKDFDGASARSDASDQEAWDVAIEANELVGTDLPGALALFDRAIKLSARSGAADPGLQQLWAEVAIEVGVPDAQTRQVIDSVIATTPDDDPGAMAYALGTLARLEHRAHNSCQAQTLMTRAVALHATAGQLESMVSTLAFQASMAMTDGDRNTQVELLTRALATTDHHSDEPWADGWRQQLNATLHEQRTPWDELTAATAPTIRSDAALARARHLSSLGDVGGAQAAYRFALLAMERDGAVTASRWRVLLEVGRFLSENADVIEGGHELAAAKMLEALELARRSGSNDWQTDAAVDLAALAPSVSGALRGRIDAEVEETTRHLSQQDRPDTHAALLGARILGLLTEGRADEARLLVVDLTKLAATPIDRMTAANYRAAVESVAEDPRGALLALEDCRAALRDMVADADADGWTLRFDQVQTLTEGAANQATLLNDGDVTRRWIEIGKAYATGIGKADALDALDGIDLSRQLAERLRTDQASMMTCTDLGHRLIVTLTDPSGRCRSHRVETPTPINSLIPQLAGTAAAIAARAQLFASLETVGALLGEILTEAVSGASHLYVIADGSMWSLPWAALPLADGRMLSDALSVSLVPSIGWLVSSPRGSDLAVDTALAIGVGEEQGFGPLAASAVEVADLGWLRSTLLIDDAAKPHVVLDALGDHDVAYLIAHGEVSDNADVLAAASIELAGKARLDGRMLASTAHPVARTMMLNACYSGVMLRGRTDLPGGFWTGLLRGGAMSACITTAAVDPTPAHAIALGYLAQLRDPTIGPGAALRSAQLELRESGAPPEDWACHTLVGVA